MQTTWLTAEQYAQLSSQVQGAFISPLPAFQVLNISGPDKVKYLQGQSTCDLTQLTSDRFLRGAHCDAKGKMWSIFHVFECADTLQVVAFRDELNASTTQWQKFGVFSKVTFDRTEQHAVFGIGGEGAEQLIEKIGFVQPQANGELTRLHDATLLRLADNHYLLITSASNAQQLMQNTLPWAASTLWLKEHILQGFSYLEQPLIGELVPQMLNLQAVDAISFTKGCYVGQETVARLKYRGGNKRAAYILYADTVECPVAGSDIELQLENNWRRVGQVVNAVNLNNQLWLIALLPNDITPADALRLKSEQPTVLQQLPLPYSLN